jgi:hypothetical protein
LFHLVPFEFFSVAASFVSSAGCADDRRRVSGFVGSKGAKITSSYADSKLPQPVAENLPCSPLTRNAHVAAAPQVLRDWQAIGRLRGSPHLAGTSASEKADVRLCGAIEGNRPTAADPGAHGNRQVSNTNGHPPAGQSRRQGALTLPGRLNGEGHKLTAGSHHSPHRNSPITDFPITRARMSWAQRLKRVFGIDIETMTYRFLRTF